MDERALSAREVWMLVGISKRQLDYWEEAGYVPRGNKNFAGHRVYSPEDVAAIRRVAKQRGMSVKP